jgi:hypothetical protein
MDTVEIGRTENDIRVFVSRPALEADAMLFINRVKPHTDFASERIGSGVRKMLVIGLGKAAGAFECHRYASGPNPKFGYERTLIEVSGFVLNNLPSIFGLALVEDGYHKLARIEAMAGSQIGSREPGCRRSRLSVSTCSLLTRWGKTSADQEWTRTSLDAAKASTLARRRARSTSGP